MQVEQFYQIDAEIKIPLILVSKTQWTNQGDQWEPLTKNFLLTQQFQGRLGDVGIVYDASGCAAKVYIGTGDDALGQAMAYAATRVPVATYYLEQPLPQSAMVAWSLAQYRFLFKKANERSPRVLLVPASSFQSVLQESRAVFLVRDLINMPANELGPKQLAEVVQQLANQYGAQFQQWVGAELLRDNFPAIHAVGRAAADEPRLLSFTWGKAQHPRIALVGKGVCFDSGGLDIKPSSGMRFMKKDMGGAAHVLGLAQWIMSMQLPVQLQVLIPAVENAISANAYRPGDVITTRQGLCIEVDNTDAEGRIILADALTKACEASPELIIDFATLTGAARVAVGTEIAAMFTNRSELSQAMMNFSELTGDAVWPLPLFRGYANFLDSSVADLANSSASPYAGAIVAALFLQRFVTEATPWLHFDMMAWNVSSKPGKPEGGEAMGMQALAHYLIQRYG